MRPFWIMLVVVAMAIVIALPATAKKPPKPPVDPPAVVVCEFDTDGVLQNWRDLSLSGPYSCQWTTTARGPFTFKLAPGSGADEGTVLRPHLFVTDAYPYGDKCFEQLENGWHTFTTDEPYIWGDEPHIWGPFTLPTNGECDSGTTNVTDPDPDGPNVFRLLISARTVKGATLEVTLTQ